MINRSAILLVLVSMFLAYSSFIYLNLPDNSKHDKDADNGKLVWQKYNCGACHQVYGLGGFLGPDLTNVVSRQDSNYMAALIRHGTDVMPAFGIPDKEIREILSYLKAVDRTGNADPRSFKISADGFIRQKND